MLSEFAKNITPSITLAITAKANQLKKEGVDVVGFGAGQPDFDTPQNIKDAAKKAIDDGFTKYTPASGIPELKKAVCDKFKRDNNLEYSPNQIVIGNGGKHILINVFRAMINEGDEVIIPVPYWVSYPEQVKLCGGVPVFCPTRDLKLKAQDVEGIITDKTKMIIINSPSNPTGAVFEKEELEKIAKLCVEKNIYIISDDVYEFFLYDGETFTSMANLGEDVKRITFIVNAVSKSYAMTGWRIGYCAGPADAIKAMGSIQSHQTSNPCSIAQKAALEAITGPQDSIKVMWEEFDKRRKYMVERLNKMKGVKCAVPKGAFYAFPDISGTGLKSMEFCDKLLTEKNVAAVPGIGFGADNFMRLSYATSMENIKKGLDRMEEFCNGL